MTTHKKHIYILTSCLLFFTACEKEKDDVAHSPLIGTWEWKISCGGYTGGCWSPEDDQQYRIEFRTDNIYVQYFNGDKTGESAYSITDTTKSYGREIYHIQFSEWNAEVWISGMDTLYQRRGDFVESYSRVK